jgi:hypothetical protein
MPRIDDLYSSLNQKGLYTKSPEEFKKQFSTPEAISQLHFALKQDKLFTGSLADFNNQFFSDQLKKKEEALPSMPSAEGGFLGTSPTEPRVPSGLSGDITEAELIDFMPFAPDEAVVRQYLPENFESLSPNEKAKATVEVLKVPGVKDVLQSRIDYQKNVDQAIADRTQAAIDKEVDVESDYFTGEFSDFLKAMDNPMVNIGWMGLGEKIDDLGRAIATGLAQGDIVEETIPMAWGGSKTSDQDIDKYIAISKKMDELGPSNEMVRFQNIYEAAGGDVFAAMKAMYHSPGAIPEILATSLSSMLNTASLSAAGTTVAGGAGVGALTGAAPGAITGAIKAVPYAFSAANGFVEYGSSFNEFLKEELENKGLDFTRNGIKAVLEDPEALSRIRNRASARAGTVVAIDALTANLAGSVGAKLANTTRAGQIKAAAATTGIEMAGGSIGEATARGIAGQEQDAAEILLEGVGEGPMGVVDIASAVAVRNRDAANAAMKPDQRKQYQENKAKIEALQRSADASTDETVASTMREAINSIKDQNEAIKKDVSDVVSNLSEEDKDNISRLTKEADDLKNKAIKINDDPNIDKETKVIALGELKKQAIAKLQEQQTIIDNAVQKQTTSEVPVQPEARVGEEVAEGAPEAKPEVVTEEGVQEEVTPETYVQELKRTKSSDPAQYWTVDSVDLEAAKDGTIVSVDGGYGVVSKEGDIKGVFKTPETTRKGVADDILKKAVEAGGIKLDNFDNYLTPIYKRNGFKIVSRLPFSEEAAPSDWTKAQGTPDVVAMVYDPDNKLNIEEKTFENYDEAMAYRDSYVEQAKQAYQVAAPVDQATVGQTIQKTAQSLQVAFPEVEFIVGDNLEDTRARIVEALTPRVGMEKAQEVANDFKDVRGQALFADEKPVAIVVDKAAANTRTAGHEAWEVMLNDAFGKNPEKFAEFRNSIDRQLRLAGYNEIATELQKFSEQYAKEGNEVVFREYMAEFGGMLTEGGFDIKNLTPQQKSLLQKIKDIINDFAMQLTGKEVFLKDATAENIIDFMSTISQKVAKGETVEEFFVEPAKTDEFGNIPKPSIEARNSLIQKEKSIEQGAKESVVPGRTASTRVSADQNIHSTNEMVVGVQAMIDAAKVNKRAEEHLIKVADELSKYPVSKKKTDVKDVKSAIAAINDFKGAVKENLKWLYDQFGEEVRGISKLWYDGANKISNEIAKKNNLSIEQVSGVMAVLSPQKDWFMNLSLGERVIDVFKNKQDYVIDQKMIDYIKNAKSGTGTKAKPLFNPKITSGDINKLVDLMSGKKFKELDTVLQSYFVRAYDEVYNSKDYNNITPDGQVNGFVKKANGENGKVAWGDFGTIAKALSILKDGSIENISQNIGDMHKVRNFYNNIVDPNDTNAVTIDTHAVAAALLKPLSGSAEEVTYNFSGPSNKLTGTKGSYAVYADAYRELANELGLLPREVQSITWEAVRGLFKPQFKAKQKNVDAISEIWDNYKNGKITKEQVYESINEKAGGISTPVWYDYMATGSVESLEANSAATDQAELSKIDEQQRPIDTTTGIEITSRAQKINYKDLPGYDRMRNEVDGIIEKAKKRGATKARIAEDVINYVQKSAVYERANDSQREQMIRDLKKELGQRVKSAPKAERLLGTIKDAKKVTVDEMVALKEKIKAEAKAAKDAVAFVNSIRAQIASEIKAMEKSGVLSAKQVQTIINKASKVNLTKPDAVNNFVDYMEKVFKNAEYGEKLSQSNTLQRKIKNLSKSDRVAAGTKAVAKQFAKIEPRRVVNIEEYLEYASALYNAMKPTVGRVTEEGADVGFKSAVEYDKVQDYANEEIKRQEKQKVDEILARNEDLVMAGVLTEDMNIDEIKKIIDAINSEDPTTLPPAEKEKMIRDYVKKAFGYYRTIALSMIQRGVDPFTGEEIELTESQKKLARRFLEVDTDMMPLKEAYAAVEAIDNFIVNKVTDGMAATIADYVGQVNANNLAKEGYRGKPLRLFYSKKAGRAWAEQIEQLDLMVQRMFGGVNKALAYMRASGANAFKVGKTTTQVQLNNILNKYAEKFGDVKGFRDLENVMERGVLAFVSRSVNENSTKQQNEFERRKALVEETLSYMKTGTEKEQSQAVELQKVYDNILKWSNSIDQVEAKVKDFNKEAVKFWIDEWSNKYDQLQDLSRNVYNVVLGSDINYTPDRFKRVSGKDVAEAQWGESMFANSNDYFDTKEAGVLMENKRIQTLGKRPSRVVSFDFDVNMSNSMYDALMDINTAEATRQMKSFFNSEGFEKIVPTKEDRDLMVDRMKKFIIRSKRKDYVSQDQLSGVFKAMNTIAGLGAGRALGGILQAPKQTIGVAFNTMINSGGRLSVVDAIQANQFINDSGYAIALRGIASNADIQSINKILEKASQTKGDAALKLLNKASEMWLNTFLVKPDVWIARTSWISYYKQQLDKMGYDTSNIDWTTHKLNKEAADYAQAMLDRQQNYSDSDLAGEFFASKEPLKMFLRKTFFPFMTFVMNQKSRMYADLSIIGNKDASTQEKINAGKSLTGMAIELAIYSGMSMFFSSMLSNLTDYLRGEEESEEEKKKRMKRSMQYYAKNIVSDILSPLPVTNEPVRIAFNMALEKIGIDKDTFELPRNFEKAGVFKDLGMNAIAAEKLLAAYDKIQMAATGKFMAKDFFGNDVEKQVDEETREKMMYVAVADFMYALGFAPSEFGTIANKATKKAQKKGKKVRKSGSQSGGVIEGEIIQAK